MKGKEVVYIYHDTIDETSHMIDREGNIFGYVPGSMTKDIMDDVIRQTLEGGKSQ